MQAVAKKVAQEMEWKVKVGKDKEGILEAATERAEQAAATERKHF